MKFSHTKFEDSKIDRNDIEYNLSLQLSDFSSKFMTFLLEKKLENITYEDLKSFEKSEIEDKKSHPRMRRMYIYLSFKKAAQLLRLLKVEGFDNEDDELNERFLFRVLFGSTPTYEQFKKRIKFINDLSRMTIEPFKSCIFNQSSLTKDVQKYIFKEEDSRLYMLVNVNHGKGINGEEIKIAEHIYIHKLPSVIIGKWVRQMNNPSISKDPPLAKLLHKYAISVIQPDYIVSNPLSIMDPVFSELKKEEFLENIPLDSDEFKKIIKNIPFNFYSTNNRTCEEITVMFKVINIPDIQPFSFSEIEYKDCKVHVYIEGLTTYALGSRCGETIGDIKKFLKLHPNEQLAERDLHVSLPDDMPITKDMNLWLIPETIKKECKIHVYNKGIDHFLGSRCDETIGDIKKFLKLTPNEELAKINQHFPISDDTKITEDMNLWIIEAFKELPPIEFSNLLNPSNNLFSTPAQFSQTSQFPQSSQFFQFPQSSQFLQVPNKSMGVDLSSLINPLNK
jgi:hypothetical protein